MFDIIFVFSLAISITLITIQAYNIHLKLFISVGLLIEIQGYKNRFVMPRPFKDVGLRLILLGYIVSLVLGLMIFLKGIE